MLDSTASLPASFSVQTLFVLYHIFFHYHSVPAVFNLGLCQTREKVAQFSPATLLSDKIACLTWQVAQLLMINLPNGNHLYPLAIYR